MELDFTLTTISIFVIIMLIMFARVNISYQPGEGSKPVPTVKRPLLNSRNDTTKSVIKNDKNDEHDNLRTKFYYDNCKFRLLEEFVDECNHPFIKIKYDDNDRQYVINKNI